MSNRYNQANKKNKVTKMIIKYAKLTRLPIMLIYI